MRKLITIALVLSLLMLTMPLQKKSSIVSADATHTEFEVIVDETDINNATQITASIYVTPQDGQSIDTIDTNKILFSKNTLEAVDVAQGDIFAGLGMDIWDDGTIDNTNGEVTYVSWGTTGETNTPGYFCNVSFNITGTGDTYIKIDEFSAAYEGPEVPSKITQNFSTTIQKMQISNEYPANESKINEQSPTLGINITHYDGSPMNLLWHTNISGIWKMMGWNISTYSGHKTMSSYGVVASPYNQSIEYEMNGLIQIDEIFTSNNCEGKPLGPIKAVEIKIPGLTGSVTPIYHGTTRGTDFPVSSANNYSVDVTNGQRAPVNWSWDDIKNLDVEMSSLKTSGSIIVTYDMQFGEGIEYWWEVEVSDGSSTIEDLYVFNIRRQSPIISNMEPTEGGTPASYAPTLSADIEQPQGKIMNISFYALLNETWQQIGSNQTGYNGTYTQSTDAYFYNYSEDQYWKLIVSANNKTTTEYSHFITREEQQPPKNFTAETTDAYSVNLTWDIPDYVDKIKIKRSTVDFPEYNDSGLIYENDGDHFTDSSGVIPGQIYYYSAWSYNGTDDTWGSNKSIIANITLPLQPTDLQVMALDYNIINVTWDRGTGTEYTHIRRKMGSYPTDIYDGTCVYNGTGNQFDDTSGIGGNISYYYRAWSLCDEHVVYEGTINEFNGTANETILQWSTSSISDMDTTPVGPPSPQTQTTSAITKTSATLNAYLLSDGGEDALCGFFWGNDTAHHNQTIGTYETGAYYSHNLTTLQTANEYYVQAWASNNYGFITSSNISFWTQPYDPATIEVTPIPDTTSLNISWTYPAGNNGIDNVQLQLREDDFPTEPTNGTTIYFGDSDHYILDGLFASIPTRNEYHTAYHEQTTHYCYYSEPWSVIDNLKIYNSNWASQTFTVGNNGANEYNYLTSVKLRLYKQGNPGPVYVSIRNASAIDGMPYTYKWQDTHQTLIAPADEYDLQETVFDGNSVPAEYNTENYTEITFNDPLLLKKNHRYAIVVRAPYAESSNALYWVKDPIKSNYGGGDCFYSTTGGSSWSEEYYQYNTYWGYQYGRADMNFEIYGKTVFGLEGNKTYYISAWGHNSSQNIYSQDYTTASNTTYPNEVVIDATSPENIEENSISLTSYVAISGANTGSCGFKYGTSSGSYTGNYTATGSFGEGDMIYGNLSALTSGKTYFYRAWSKNGDVYYEDYEETFTTKPAPPQNLQVTAWGARQLNVSWTKNDGQDTTIVTRKQGSAPTSISDGLIRYTGNATSFKDTHDDTEIEPCDYTQDLEENTAYYYSAWSYNETVGLNGTSFTSASNSTESEPGLSGLVPEDLAVNVDTPANLSAIATASSGDISLKFWDVHEFDMGTVQTADHGTSSTWSEAWEINNTAGGYDTKRTNPCYSQYITWDRKFAYRRMSTGGTTLDTGKLTASFDHPRLISGIYISYGKYSNPPNSYGTIYYMGEKNWHMEYHDYYNDQWITANDYAPNGDHTIATNDLTVVDKVRVWMTSYYDGDLQFECDVRVNYIQSLQSELINETSITSGERGHVIWPEANSRDSLYYYGVTADDGKTIIGSDIKYFYTEDLIQSNPNPAHGSTVGIVPENHTISIDIEHTRGQPFDVDIDYSNYPAPYVWNDEQEWADQSNGTFTWIYEDSGDYGQSYYWRVITTDGVINNTQIYRFTTRNTYRPDNPSLSVNVVNATQINFTAISVDSNTDALLLRYDMDTYPSSPTDGLEVINQTTTSNIYHQNLEANTEYFYTIYAWNSTDNLYSAGANYARTTEGPSEPTFNVHAHNMTVINITNITGNIYATSFLIYANLSAYQTDRAATQDMIVNTTESMYNHTGLLPRQTWYYTVWAWDEEHQAYGEPSFANTTTLGPLIQFSTTTYNQTAINITNIQGNEFTDRILIRYKKDSYPQSRTDGSLLINQTYAGSPLWAMSDNLQEVSEYYYRGWGYNQTFATWGRYYNKTERTDGPVAVSSPYPADVATNVERNPTLAITVEDYDDSSNIDITFRGINEDTGSWETIGTQTNKNNGRYSVSSSIFDSPVTSYTWSVNVTDGTFWTNETYSFTTTNINPPTQFTLDLIEGYPSTADLSWVPNPEAPRTIIMRKAGSKPNWPNDGVEVYNGTGMETNDTLTDPGTVYYYKAYAYVGSNVGGAAETYTLTPPEAPQSVTVSTASHRSVSLNWVKGQGADYTYIVMHRDFYPGNKTDGTIVYNASGTATTVSGLEVGDYLNYFTVNPQNNTIGSAAFEDNDPDPGQFAESADYNTSTEWDLQQVASGTATYLFNTTRNQEEFPGSTQKRNETIRLFAGKILFQDFYHVDGASWNSSLTALRGYNGSYVDIWTGEKWNSGTEKEWWAINRTYSPPIYTQEEKEQIEIPNATRMQYGMWTNYVTPDIFEVQAGKLGYEYCFTLWSVSFKDNLTSFSFSSIDGKNRTEDAPNNYVPELHDYIPPHGSEDKDPYYLEFTVNISDKDADLMDVYFQTNRTGEWETFATKGGVGNGTHTIATTTFSSFNTTFWWRVRVKDDADVTGSVYQTNWNTSDAWNFTIREAYYPEAPSNLTATTVGLRSINLQWDKGITNTDRTAIVMKKGSMPQNQSDGQIIYNDEGTQYTRTNLNPDAIYYFKAWSRNETDNVYSIANDTAYNWTGSNQKPNISSPTPANGAIGISRFLEEVSAAIEDADADELYWTINGTHIQNDSGYAYNDTISAATITPLPDTDLVYWTVHIFDGYNWTNTTYHFTTTDNAAPYAYNISPAHQETDISKNTAQITFNLADPNGNTIDWSAEGDHIVNTGGTNDNNGSYSITLITPLPYDTEIVWHLNTTDGADSLNRTYTFTTEHNHAPTITNDDPFDGSTGVSIMTENVSIDIADPNGDMLDWTIHGNFLYINTNSGSGAGNGTYSATTNTPLPTNSQIIWYVNVTDGVTWSNRTLFFNTSDNADPDPPSSYSVESKTGYGRYYTSVYDVYLNATVTDPNGDPIDALFYVNGRKIGEVTGLASGSTASLCINSSPNASHWNNGTWEPRNFFNHSVNYTWQVKATDGMATTDGPLDWFNTSEKADMNEDGRMSPSDISYFLSQYGIDEYPGGKTWADINEDARTSPSDISYFLSAYGEDYYP